MDKDFILPEGQKWKRGKRRYWFVNERMEVVWRYWEGDASDVSRREGGNYFQQERDALRNRKMKRMRQNL